MSDEKQESNLTTTILVSLIALLLGGLAVYFWQSWSSHGDTPVIMSDGGSSSFVRFRHRNKPWVTVSTSAGVITGYTTKLRADSWRIADLTDEVTNVGATITIPPGAASVAFSPATSPKLLTVTPANGVTCRLFSYDSNNIDDTVQCPVNNTTNIDLSTATVQVRSSTVIHTPVTSSGNNFFYFLPE